MAERSQPAGWQTSMSSLTLASRTTFGFQGSSGLVGPRRVTRISREIQNENSKRANCGKTWNLPRFTELTSRGRQGLDAAMFLHAFEPLPRWRSPLLRAVAPLYRNRKKKQRVDIQTNWGKLHTAHSRRHPGDRRAQPTPFFETLTRGAGGRAEEGGGRGAETGKGK